MSEDPHVALALNHTYRSRKFGLAVASFISNCMMLVMGFTTPDVWKDVTIAIVLLYSAGSVGDKFAGKK
jgi:hypothetical protein